MSDREHFPAGVAAGADDLELVAVPSQPDLSVCVGRAVVELEHFDVWGEQQELRRERCDVLREPGRASRIARELHDGRRPLHEFVEDRVSLSRLLGTHRPREPECGEATLVGDDLANPLSGVIRVESERAGATEELGPLGDLENRLEPEPEPTDLSPPLH